jgi:hypothetical protein
MIAYSVFVNLSTRNSLLKVRYDATGEVMIRLNGLVNELQYVPSTSSLVNGPVGLDGSCSYCAPAQPQSSGFGHDSMDYCSTKWTSYVVYVLVYLLESLVVPGMW